MSTSNSAFNYAVRRLTLPERISCPDPVRFDNREHRPRWPAKPALTLTHSGRASHSPFPAAPRARRAREEARSETADAIRLVTIRQLRRIRVPCGDRRLRRESARTAPIAERRHLARATEGSSPRTGLVARVTQALRVARVRGRWIAQCTSLSSTSALVGLSASQHAAQ